MKVHYLDIDVSISERYRINIIRPVFHKYNNLFIVKSSKDENKVNMIRDNIHQILVNAYEAFIRRSIINFLEKESGEGILPTASVNIDYYSDKNTASIKGMYSKQYMLIPEKIFNLIENMKPTYFEKYIISEWLTEISRCLGLHTEQVFKGLNNED